MDVTDAWLAAVASARWTTKAASPGFTSSTCVKSRTAFATASTSTFPNKSADATHGIITDPFTQQAREVLDSIRTKEEILNKNRGRYVDPYRYVPSRAANMTDLERDQIDQVMASFIIKCGSQIEILRCALAEASSLEAGGGNADLVGGEGSRLAHHGKVVAYLAERLQDLGNTLQNLQARRRHLNGLVPSSSGADAGQACRPGSTTRTLTTPSWSSFAKAGGSHKAKGRPIMAPNKLESDEDEAFRRRLAAREAGRDVGEQVQRQAMLEHENRVLTVRLNNELHDVKIMEGKMEELSQLLGLFTGELLEQQGQVEEVHEAARGTHENLGHANKELLATLERNSKASQTMFSFVLMLCIALLVIDQVMP